MIAEDHDIEIIEPPPKAANEVEIQNIDVLDDELYDDLGVKKSVEEQEKQPELEQHASVTEPSTVSVPVLPTDLLSVLVEKAMTGARIPPSA